MEQKIQPNKQEYSSTYTEETYYLVYKTEEHKNKKEIWK